MFRYNFWLTWVSISYTTKYDLSRFAHRTKLSQIPFVVQGLSITFTSVSAPDSIQEFLIPSYSALMATYFRISRIEVLSATAHHVGGNSQCWVSRGRFRLMTHSQCVSTCIYWWLTCCHQRTARGDLGFLHLSSSAKVQDNYAHTL